MADAYSTIVQQNIAKKQQETQSRANELNTRADTINTAFKNLASLTETGVKLGYQVYQESVNEDLRKVQNKHAEEDAYGVFDRIDMSDENSGVEADPEKVFQNHMSWLEDFVSNPENGIKHANKVKKSFTEYLEGKKASIIEAKNTQNYNTLKTTISNGIDYMNSAYYDPDTDDINLTIPNIFNDQTHRTVEDLTDVTEYGIGDLTTNYLEQKEKYENGEENDYYKADYELRYALGAYSAGESEYAFKLRKESDFDTDYLSYEAGRWARAFGESVKQQYINSGYDSTVITDAISDITGRIYNEGITVDEKGIKLTAADLGTSGISYALQQAEVYTKNICGLAANEQTALGKTAAQKWDEKYSTSSMLWTNEEDAVNELVEMSGGGLNSKYAKSLLTDDVKATIRVNAKNKEIGTMVSIMANTDASVEDRQKAIDYAVANNLVPLFTEDTGFGFGNLYDTSDDKANAPALQAIKKTASKDNLSMVDAFVKVYAGQDVSGEDYAKTAPEKIRAEYNLLSYNAQQSVTKLEDAIADELSKGNTIFGEDDKDENEAIKAVFGDDLSWDEFETYKTAVKAIEADPALLAYSKSSPERAKSVLYAVLASNGESGASGDGTTKTVANKTLDTMKANVAFASKAESISLGYVVANKKDNFINSDGYEEEIVAACVSSELKTLIGDTPEETLNNIYSLLAEFKEEGFYDDKDSYGLKAFEVELEQYKKYIGDMTADGFAQFASALGLPLSQIAYNDYNAFSSTYDTDSVLSGGEYEGQTIKGYLKDRADNYNSAFSDSYLMSLYESGELDFGEDKGNYTPSRDLLASGSVGSNKYYDVMGLLVFAGNDQDRENILNDAKKYLTKDAIETLKGLSSINLLVRKIPGMEDWDFNDEVIKALGEKSQFAYLVNKTSLSDWTQLIGNDKKLSGTVATLVKNYEQTKDVNALTTGLSDLAKAAADTYIIENDDVSRITNESTFTSGLFNPITSVSDGTISGEEYFSSWNSARTDIGTRANTSDLKTKLYESQLIDGSITSESIENLSALLQGEVDEKYIMPYTTLLALNTMGIYPGVTAQDITDNYSEACDNLKMYLSDVYKKDNDTFGRIVRLTQGLENRFETIREYNSLGYTDEYTQDISGNIIVKGVGTVSKAVDGSFVVTDAEGNTTNLSMYSGNVSLKERDSVILGEYSKGKTNIFGNKIYGTEEALTTQEGLNQISSYNTKKSAVNSVKDYSKATEIVGTVSMPADPDSVRKESVFEELTGEEITDRYMDMLVKGEDTTQYLAQLSEGMRKYVVDSSEEILAGIAFAHYCSATGVALVDGKVTVTQALLETLQTAMSDIAGTAIGLVTLDAKKVANSSVIGRLAGAAITRGLGKRAMASNITAGSPYYYGGKLKEVCDTALVNLTLKSQHSDLSSYSRVTTKTKLPDIPTTKPVYDPEGNSPTAEQLDKGSLKINAKWEDEVEEMKRKIYEAGNK